MRRLLPLFAFALLLGCNSDAAKPGGAPAPAAPDRKAEQPAAPKPAAGDAATFTIQGNDQMQYDVKQIDVKPGQKVRITMKNAGNLPKLAMGHNLVVLRKGVTLEQFKPLSEKDGT